MLWRVRSTRIMCSLVNSLANIVMSLQLETDIFLTSYSRRVPQTSKCSYPFVLRCTRVRKVMADPNLAIIGLTSAILGLYGTIRSGFQALEEDIYLWRKYETLISDIRNSSDKDYTDFKKWQDKWMLWKEDTDRTTIQTPDDFFTLFWEPRGLKDIQDRLRTIEKEAKEFNERLLPYLSRTSTSRYRTISSKWDKIRFVAKEKRRLNGVLKRLRQNISGISTKADYHFNHKWHRDQTGVSEEFIHRVGNCKRLLDLAVQSRPVCDAMYHHCQRSKGIYDLELQLNLLQDSPYIESSPDAKRKYLDLSDKYAHSRAIATAADQKCLTFHILAVQSSAPDTLTRFRIRSEPEIEFHRCVKHLAQALGQAAQPNPNGRGRGHEIYFAENERTPYFKLQEVPPLADSFPTPSHRFRELLCISPAHGTEKKHPLSRAIVAKVALELAECGLLFLGTQWLIDICSCDLHCRLIPPPIEEYHCTIGTSNTRHIFPTWGSFTPQGCWCDTHPPGTSRNLPLRRIGLLLAEIALGFPMLEERATNPYLHRDKQLIFACNQPPAVSKGSLQEIAKQLKDTTDHQYWKAVEHCLSSAVNMPVDITGNETSARRVLSEYYEKVLIP